MTTGTEGRDRAALVAQATQIVGSALRSQGGRPTRAALELLAIHLLDGGAPTTYGERFAQMALQREGLVAH
jgi:hypothetical protein